MQKYWYVIGVTLNRIYVTFSIVHLHFDGVFFFFPLQIRKMDLEARALPPNIKSSLLVKLREFKSDLNNFKSEVKRITTGSLNAAARDELLEAGMADTVTVCKRLSSIVQFDIIVIFASKTTFDWYAI